MSNIPELTIAIPTYNRENYLKECLTSISRQTFKNFQVIIFDNASGYDVRKLISEFPEINITLDANEYNIGNQENFKKILAFKYTTPYIMVLHDDDAIHPNYLETAIKILSNEKVNWISTTINKYRDGKGSILDFKNAPTKPDYKIYNKDSLIKAFMLDSDLCFSSVIYCSSVLSTTRPDIEHFKKWFDRPFLAEAVGNSKVAIITFPYINYRIHPSQDSAQEYNSDINEFINFTKYYTSNCDDKKVAMQYSTKNMLLSSIDNFRTIKQFIKDLNYYTKLGLYNTKNITPRTLYQAIKRIISKLIH